MAVVVLFAIGFSVLALRHRGLQRHDTAIAELQRLNAQLTMTNRESRVLGSTSDAVGDWRRTFLASPDVYVPSIRLNTPGLTRDDVRRMVPYLNDLISLYGQNSVGESFIALDINCASLMTPDFCDELKSEIPNCRFIGDPTRKPGPSPYGPDY